MKLFDATGHAIRDRAPFPALVPLRLSPTMLLEPRPDIVSALLAHYRAERMPAPRQIGAWTDRSGLRVIASLDDTGPTKWGPLLHVSVSYPDHDPGWGTIKAVKAAFYGDGRDAMMILPTAATFVNLHEHCFHLWETPERWDMR